MKKFEIHFDDEVDFKTLFSNKIGQLETFITIYTDNPIEPMNEINKNCIKYKNAINKKTKSEQRLNANKKNVEEINIESIASIVRPFTLICSGYN